MGIFTSRRVHERVNTLTRRPEPVNGISIPTVRNLNESAIINPEFGAVLTAGPSSIEVDWGHPNHRVWTFDDVEDQMFGPQLHQVEEMVFWGADQDDLLVHCHAGISRSTATAWGVCIAKGLDPYESALALSQAHPMENYGLKDTYRWFSPNPLLVSHLQTIFNDRSLLEVLRDVLTVEGRSTYGI